MRSLAHLVWKEWLVLARDWHALLLLFAMPVMFILVMSLALRDQFAGHGGVEITYYLRNEDAHPSALAVEQALRDDEHFTYTASDADESELRARVERDEVQFLVVIPAGFGDELLGDAPLAVRVTAGPGVAPALDLLFESAVRGAATAVSTERTIEKLQQALTGTGAPPGSRASVPLVERTALGERVEPRPTAVQQNVPAWLLFAMFFIAIPLSTTWVQERQQGTLARLRSMGVPRLRLLAGKLVPYLAINVLQVALMLAVGVWLVPLCGGERLDLGASPPALVVVALAASLASVSYALLIANIVRTAEQATIFTGVANLLLAVLGGVMVPRFVMPPVMRAIGEASPMTWGLEGFLDVFLRGGGPAQVSAEALRLTAFALACLGAALVCMRRVRGK